MKTSARFFSFSSSPVAGRARFFSFCGVNSAGSERSFEAVKSDFVACGSLKLHVQQSAGTGEERSANGKQTPGTMAAAGGIGLLGGVQLTLSQLEMCGFIQDFACFWLVCWPALRRGWSALVDRS